MSLIKSVQVAAHPATRLEQVIGGERQARLVRAAKEFRARLGGRTIWNVTSTAVGGGVAEMLQVLVGYVEDLGISIRWVVITGDAEFFAITKRLHNQIHGQVAECLQTWRDLPTAARARVLLVTLPLDDVDENAAMVNALQRHAAVITQKSLAEGFGLTVAEGMWKGRPVVGSAVGGIADQIAPGAGILLSDPQDGAAFGAAVRGLLDNPSQASTMGHAAQAHVRDNYVGDLHLLRYDQMFTALLSQDKKAAQRSMRGDHA